VCREFVIPQFISTADLEMCVRVPKLFQVSNLLSTGVLRNPISRPLLRLSSCTCQTQSGPSADPGGKERTAWIISSSVISTATVSCGSGTERRSGGSAGCLSTSCAYTLSVFCAGLSSEHMILIAALMSPSSILDETALASRVAASVDLVLWLTISWSADPLLDDRRQVVPLATSSRLSQDASTEV